MKGGAIPKRSRDAWIKSLSSDSVADRLATLAWLSGSHLSSAEKRYKNVNQESAEHSKLYESVRDSPATKKALSKLRKSNIGWVREYAKLALEKR